MKHTLRRHLCVSVVVQTRLGAYLIYEGKVESEGNSDFLLNDPITRDLYLGDRFSM